VHAISSDDDEVLATFLLGEGAPLIAETTNSTLPEPDNSEAVGLMTDRMARPRRPQPGTTSITRILTRA
jgi:hypothetical protein